MSLPTQVGELRAVKEMSFYCNNLDFIPCQLGGLKALEILDLRFEISIISIFEIFFFFFFFFF